MTIGRGNREHCLLPLRFRFVFALDLLLFIFFLLLVIGKVIVVGEMRLILDRFFRVREILLSLGGFGGLSECSLLNIHNIFVNGG